MTILGMPGSMALIFGATILAGSLGAIHFVIVHMIMGRPFGDEEHAIGRREAGERMSDAKRGRKPGTPGPTSNGGATHG